MSMSRTIEKERPQTLSVVIPAFCRIRDEHDFYAVTADLSMQGVRLRSARIPRHGDVLECRIRNVDPFEGRVVQTSAVDFTVKVGGSSPGTVARQLLEAARQQIDDKTGVRTHRRIVPGRSAISVVLEDERTFEAEILNVSASGAAIGTSEAVALGSLIVLGCTHARVMRAFVGGFGAAFLQPFDPARVDADLIL